MSIADHARALAAAGFHIFPCRPNEKLPAIAEWQLKASNDADWIEHFWPEEPQLNLLGGYDPEYNIGVATGHGIIAIDIDMKGGKNGKESFAAFQDLYGPAPPTVTVRTPTGGTHYYYRVPETVKLSNAVNVLGCDGVDIRAINGYVLSGGSKIDGVEYRQNGADLSQVAEIPGQWLPPLPKWHERARDHTDPVVELDDDFAIAAAVKYLERAEPALQGSGGDHRTFVTAAHIADLGVSEPFCTELMLEHWNDRCQPPWDAGELQTKVENAYHYRILPIGGGRAEAEFSPVLIDEGAAPVLRNRLTAYQALSATEHTAGGALVQRLIGLETMGIMYGQSNTGKSFLALWLAYCVASGRDFAGNKVYQPGLAVYIAAEGARSTNNRILAIRKTFGDEGLENLWVVPCEVSLREKSPDMEPLIGLINDIVTKMGGTAMRMITVDTVSRSLAGANENSAEDMTAFVANLDRLKAEFVCSILGVHHSGKDQARGARGHSSYRAAADFELEVQTPEGSIGGMQGWLVVQKQRDMEIIAPIKFRMQSVDLYVDDNDEQVTSLYPTFPVTAEEEFALDKLSPLTIRLVEIGEELEKESEKGAFSRADLREKATLEAHHGGFGGIGSNGTIRARFSRHFNEARDAGLFLNVEGDQWVTKSASSASQAHQGAS